MIKLMYNAVKIYNKNIFLRWFRQNYYTILKYRNNEKIIKKTNASKVLQIF